MQQTDVRILIVKIGAIGDAVMALPLLSAIRKKYPDAHLTWLCGAQIAPLIRATRLVDQILEVDEKQLLAGSFFAKILHLLQVWRHIGCKHFDFILTLHPDPRYRLLSLFSFAPDRKHFQPRRGHYHAEEYSSLLPRLSTDAIEFPIIHTPPCSIRSLKPLIAIAPGGAKNVLRDSALRRWPIESYVRLIHDLEAHGIQTVVIGSDTDRWVLPFLPEKTQHFIGKMDLVEVVGLFKECSLLITHDSGPLHLAKLARCPAVALFGPTDPKSFVSSQENIKVLWGGEHLSCRPCYNGKTYAPCQNNVCLSSILPETVLQTALEMVQEKKSKARCCNETNAKTAMR
jgi:heptosyltransferase II